MYAALNEQDLLCRVFGDCLAGDPIDREVGDLIGSSGPLPHRQAVHLRRYNAELSAEGLAKLGCGHIDPDSVRRLDAVDSIPALREVGRAAARAVLPKHFAQFPA